MQPTTEAPAFLSLYECSIQSGADYKALRRAIARGELAAALTGNRWIVSAESFAKWLKIRKDNPPPRGRPRKR